MGTASNALALPDDPEPGAPAANAAALLPSPAEFRVIREIGEVMAASGYFRGALKPAQAIAAILAGREYGIGPWQSLSLMHVIEGKPTLAADAMAGLVQRWCRRNGGYLRVVEQTAQRATVAYRRPEWDDESRVAFTAADAQAAGLVGKDNWRKYPADMLKARALARACRTGFPDVCAGLHDPDEIEPAPVRPVGAADRRPPARIIPPATGESVHVLSAGAAPPPPAPAEADGIGVPGEPAEDAAPAAAMRGLHAAGRDRGLDHADLHAIAVRELGVASLTELRADELTRLAAEVAAADDDAVADWLRPAGDGAAQPSLMDSSTADWLAAIAGAGDKGQLLQIYREMNRAKVKDQGIWARYQARMTAFDRTN